jgi:5-methylcytosine-specific restriction protein B
MRFDGALLSSRYMLTTNFCRATKKLGARLILLLKKLNSAIADRHYEVGITFFLRDNLESQIADIWQMEIEPYLEEFYFDQPQKFEPFRWQIVRALSILLRKNRSACPASD